ncbi:MAG TPA: alpha/beta hydrolase [Candidatus Krumholzibacteria bacterium]|nr:alpha/beta hydrolase [Candidatus Krumholzibacteria bacterium]
MQPDSHRISLAPETFRGVPAERGIVRVPVRHAAPDGPSLELRFVRLAGAPGGVPLVFLTGGPGLSGIRSGEGRLFPMFDALRGSGDVILLDQRACVAGEMVASSPAPKLPWREVVSRDRYLLHIRRSIRHGAEILAERGIPTDVLNTNESADDVALLMRALYGDDAVASLLGWSYGSHLAMAILKRHEAMVARAVLAAPEGPDHTFKRPIRIQGHLERLARRASMDLAGMMSRALDRLEREPATVFMPGDDENAHAEHANYVLGRFDLEWMFAEGIADTRVMRRLPAVLTRMERGEFQVIGSERLLRTAWKTLRNELPFGVVRYAMDCASGATAARLALIEREARETLLGNTVDFPLPQICDALGCPDLGDEFRSSPRSKAPTLFITGTLDCRTPAQNVADLAPGLPNHAHVVVEDAGHGDLLLGAAVQSAIVRFIAGETPGSTHLPAGEPFAFESTLR